MSKLLKRTLTFALIFCLVLSVMAPLASANTATQTVTYTFTKAKAGSVSDPNSYAATDYTTTNWYILNAQANLKWTGTYGIQYTGSASAGPSFYSAFSLQAPTAGQYDVILDLRTAFVSPTAEFSLFKKSDVEGNFAESNANNNLKADDLKTTLGVTPVFQKVVDESWKLYNGANDGDVSIYLGNYALEATEYVLIMQPYKSDAAAALEDTKKYYVGMSSLIQEPSAVAGAAYIDRINAQDSTGWGSARNCFQLAESINCPEKELIIKNARIRNMGYDLTVGSIVGHTAEENEGGAYDVDNGATYVDPGYIEGTGKVTVTTADPDAFNGQALVNTADGVKYTTVETELCAAGADREGMAEGAKSFGFDIALIAEAYGWDLSDLEVKLDIVVDGQETGATCNYTQQNISDWATANQNSQESVFYVDIDNYAELAGQTLNFKLTVICNGAEFTAVNAYEVPAA